MDTSALYVSLPENMFFLNDHGDMLRYISLSPPLNGSIWFNHIKVGTYALGNFVPKEYAVSELFFYYHYDYAHGFRVLKCVYYRKLIINNTETIFPGKYPLQSDVTVGLHRYEQMTNPPLADAAMECNLMKLLAMFMLSLYTLDATIILPGADAINLVYTEMVHLYHAKLDQDIQVLIPVPTVDHLSRMLLTANYTCLDRYVEKYAFTIYELLFKYAPTVLPTLPQHIYNKLIQPYRKIATLSRPDRPDRPDRPGRYKLIILLKQYNRSDLLNSPSPLRQCNVYTG